MLKEYFRKTFLLSTEVSITKWPNKVGAILLPLVKSRADFQHSDFEQKLDHAKFPKHVSLATHLHRKPTNLIKVSVLFPT